MPTFNAPLPPTRSTGDPGPASDMNQTVAAVVEARTQISGVASDVAGKANVSHSHVSSDISDSSVIGRTLLTTANVTTARTALGAGTGNGNVVGTGVTAIVKLTQASYDALVTKDAATLYVIVG